MGRLLGLAVLVCATLTGGVGSKANASTLSFTGAFQSANEVQIFDVAISAGLGQFASFNVNSFGHYGGTNAAGAVIPSGGFKVVLADLVSGFLIDQVATDGISLNAFLPVFITGGLGVTLVKIALTMYPSVPNDIGGGVALGWTGTGCATTASVSDCTSGQSTPNWAVDISLGTGVVSITQENNRLGTAPLPAALPLFTTGLGALGLLGWRRKRKVAALAA